MEWRCVTTEIFDAALEVMIVGPLQWPAVVPLAATAPPGARRMREALAPRVSTAPAGLVTWVRVQTRSRVMWLRALQEKNSIDSLLILTT